jgi:hypothetical protein
MCVWRLVHLLEVIANVYMCILFCYVTELYDLSRLSQIILDEADTLLDDSFSPLTLRIIQKLKVSP